MFSFQGTKFLCLQRNFVPGVKFHHEIWPRCMKCVSISSPSRFRFGNEWWAWEDSNLRPYAYQAYALTTWATSPRRRKVRFVPFPAKAENFTHFLAPPLHSKPASLGFEMILAFLDVGFLCPSPLVEMRRIELLTPCLQGRCSPSWATPPYQSEELRVKSEDFTVYFLLFFVLLLAGLQTILLITTFWRYILLAETYTFQIKQRSALCELRLTIGYEILLKSQVSLERRWSSRTFRYGYLVTTSPQSSIPP